MWRPTDTIARFSQVLAACTLGLVAVILPNAPAAASGRPSSAVEVPFDHGYPKGALVIVNQDRRLYLVTGNGKARRYRVAVGEEFEIWTGRTFVSAKKEDPWWYPVDGAEPVAGGDPANPLGTRAMYLDWSLLRIHGTPKRSSIGRAVSNGCIRMLDEDVKDLYERVHLGAPVIAIKSMADAGLYAEAKFTGKIQDYIVEKDDGWPDGASSRRTARGAWPWDDEDWGAGNRRRPNRSRSYMNSW